MNTRNWSGAYLVTRLAEKFGDTSTKYQLRVLEWINDIQDDLMGDGEFWGFLKIKLKKVIAADTQEVDLNPQIPDAPTAAAAAGGALAAGTYQVKVAFLIFDETSLYKNSIESMPSEASAVVTIANPNFTLALTGIDLFDGDDTVFPKKIWRQIYISKNGGNYYLAAQIQNNTATTLNITADYAVSLIEPVMEPPVLKLSKEGPWVHSQGWKPKEETLDYILSFNQISTAGNPQSYARLHGDRVLFYPRISAQSLIEYYVIKRPRRIFNNSDEIQIPQELRNVIEAGVTWKHYEYFDRDGQEQKKANYDQEIAKAISKFARPGGRSLRIRDTVGDWEGREV